MKISEPTLMQLLQVRLNEAAGILTSIKRVRRASADRLLIDLYSGEAITLTLTPQGIELKGEIVYTAVLAEYIHNTLSAQGIEEEIHQCQ